MVRVESNRGNAFFNQKEWLEPSMGDLLRKQNEAITRHEANVAALVDITIQNSSIPLTDYQMRALRKAAPIHDEGKRWIDPRVFHLGILTPDQVLQLFGPHAAYSMMMMEHDDPLVAGNILYHHPYGPIFYSGDKIIDTPETSESLLLTLPHLVSADVIDAAVADRPDRGPILRKDIPAMLDYQVARFQQVVPGFSFESINFEPVIDLAYRLNS